MNYNADYFIAKFEAIPEELWCIENYTSPQNTKAHCALGHCGARMGPEADALCRIGYKMKPSLSTACINDGRVDKYPQPTPKTRILAFLRDAKEAGL